MNRKVAGWFAVMVLGFVLIPFMAAGVGEAALMEIEGYWERVKVVSLFFYSLTGLFASVGMVGGGAAMATDSWEN